jgi:hypothetical protein
LPLYDGKFDPKGYVKLELAVHSELCKHDLSEEQKILAAAGVLNDYALPVWKRTSLLATWNSTLDSYTTFKHGGLQRMDRAVTTCCLP